MKYIYMCSSLSVSQNDLQQAVAYFVSQYRVHPNIIKVPHYFFSQLMATFVVKIEVLERGKKYGMFIPTASGLIELIGSEDSEINTNSTNPMIIVEYTEIDEIMEKVVLGGEK